MTVRKLEKPDWRQFFDLLSKVLEGCPAEIEAASLALGDQVEARWLPLLGLVYDPRDDVVEVAPDGLDHLIQRGYSAENTHLRLEASHRLER